MSDITEARCPEPATEAVRRAPRNMLAGAEAGNKEIRADVSYIDTAPEKQVVLSDRLEYLARRVGGCQTEELLALLRRVMFETIAQRKY